MKMETKIDKEGNEDMERWQNQLIVGPYEVKNLLNLMFRV